MKLTTLTLLTLLTSTHAKKTNKEKCAAKKKWGGGCVDAINAFCNHGNLMTPSTFTSEGTQANANGQKDVWCYAYIDSTCSPAISLPKDVCFEQWWAMCAKAPANNGMYVVHEYGESACQKWDMGLVGNMAKWTFKKRDVNGTDVGEDDVDDEGDDEVEQDEDEDENEGDDGEL